MSLLEIELGDVLLAKKRIDPYIRNTPLYYSVYLSNAFKKNVFLKLENHQVTGSFKIRGVLNKLLKNKDSLRGRDLITVSMGNHAIAVVYASKMLNFDHLIIVPKSITPLKMRRLKKSGGRIRIYGENYDEAERYARKLEKEDDYIFISPYNDIDMIEGAGTIAIEIMNTNPSIDTIIVPIGGGGLISGVALTTKKFSNKVKVVGVQSEASPAMYESIKKGEIVSVKLKHSIAEGLHGNIEKNSITFEFVKKYVDEILLVSERDIRWAIRELYESEGIIVEGAAAVTLAALKRHLKLFNSSNICLLLSGGNIDPSHLIEAINFGD